MSSVATVGAVESGRFRTPPHTPPNDGPCSPGHLPHRAKRVKFLCNGNRFHKGTVIAITSERYRSFDSLLNELTRVLSKNNNLPNGVRTVFNSEGRKIADVSELEEDQVYVCSGPGEAFKKLSYETTNSPSTRASLRPARFSRHSSLSNPSPLKAGTIKPKIIVLIRSGNRPRKVMRLLINKRNAPSFEHFLSLVTDTVKLDTGAVRKIYDFLGTQITSLEALLESGDLFFACGSEKMTKDDFSLDLEELQAVNIQKQSLPKQSLPRNKDGVDSDGYGVSQSCWSDRGALITNKKMPGRTRKDRDSFLVLPEEFNNKYVLGELVGDGNFAAVYRCSPRDQEAEYALKIIDKAKCLGKEHMMENEVAILRDLRHPHIVRLFEVYDSSSKLLLLMELVPGGDLFYAIYQTDVFSEDNARILTGSLASALAYLHERSIVHRDVKPENLLVEMDGDRIKTLKLADFGLAQKVTEPLFRVCGTPSYVAPEILRETGYGLEIDIWAMGVILYILLCGFPPFISPYNDQDELFDDILSGGFSFPDPERWPLSDLSKDLISRMLESDPKLRYSAEDVLDHPWFEPHSSSL